MWDVGYYFKGQWGAIDDFGGEKRASEIGAECRADRGSGRSRDRSGLPWAAGMACHTATREGLGFLGLCGTTPETSGFAHSHSLPQVVEIVRRLESRQRGWEEEEDPERKGAIVFNATSEFCRTLGEIPTYGLAGNREEQEELMVGPRQPTAHALPWPALLLGGGGGGVGSGVSPAGSQ